MEDREGLELAEKGDFANGKKSKNGSDKDQQGSFSLDDELMPVDEGRDDAPSEEAVERCGEVGQRCNQEATVENNDITPLPSRRGMFYCGDDDDDYNDNGRCARFWHCFLIAYLLPVIIFPITYWSRSVLVRDDDFASATQDAFEWVLGCAMTTSVILFVILLIGIGWDNRQEIRNELSAPTPIEQYDCSGWDGDCCQGCLGICVLLALTIWLGIALINGYLLEDPDDNSSPRQDEWWAQELVKNASPLVGVSILVAAFLFVGYLALPVYSFLFHWCRRCQGYVPANANNSLRTLSSDEQVELLFLAAKIILPIGLAIIYAVRFFMGLEEDGFSAIFGWVGWVLVLFFALFALMGPSLVVYGCWQSRNDMTWALPIAILCPDSPLEETMAYVLGGGVMSVFFLGVGISMPMLSSLEDGNEPAIQFRLMDKIWVILSIESIILGVFLFIGMVIYPIYAFVFCCMRNYCCVSNHSSPGRGSAVAMQQQMDCEEEQTVATNESEEFQ